MGCIPSKNKPNQQEVVSPLLSQEENVITEPHPVQNYVVSSSDGDSPIISPDRRNGNQYLNNLVNQSVEDLIDVPSLAYTLYGTNSPYNYCEEYNYIISSVKVVDGILKMDVTSNVDKSESIETILEKPSNIDFAKINRCGEELEDIIESMKIKSESFVVDLKV